MVLIGPDQSMIHGWYFEEPHPNVEVQLAELVNGLHSGIPECCVMWYTSMQPFWHWGLAGAMRLMYKRDHEESDYVQCPDCRGREPVPLLLNGHFFIDRRTRRLSLANPGPGASK